MLSNNLGKIEVQDGFSFLLTYEGNPKSAIFKPLWIKYSAPQMTITYDGFDNPDVFEVRMSEERTLFYTKPFTLTRNDLRLARHNPPMFMARILWLYTTAGRAILEKIENRG
jgi:hypothetical protein